MYSPFARAMAAFVFPAMPRFSFAWTTRNRFSSAAPPSSSAAVSARSLPPS